MLTEQQLKDIRKEEEETLANADKNGGAFRNAFIYALDGENDPEQPFIGYEKGYEIIMKFLDNEGWDGDFSMYKGLSDDGYTLTFWITDEDENRSSEYTSYLHPDGRIESYGIGIPEYDEN